MKTDITALNRRFRDAPVETVLSHFLETYRGQIACATSFGAEDQIVTDLIVRLDPQARIFTLDTGRLAEETYALMERTSARYGIAIEAYFPDAGSVETLYRAQGVNGFRESIENRRECCRVRKIEPLRRALKGMNVWITGLRRSQSATRETMELVEWDEANGLIKLNPLIEWDDETVWSYIHLNGVPYNPLHDRGYPSIGCDPCTRAVSPGEDIRSGRWWWENPEHKECGLHGRRG